MALRDTISRNVRRIRRQLGMSQRALAKKAKVSDRLISGLETTGANITVDVLDQIALALGCPVAALVVETADDVVKNAVVDDLAAAVRRLTHAQTLLSGAVSEGRPKTKGR